MSHYEKQYQKMLKTGKYAYGCFPDIKTEISLITNYWYESIYLSKIYQNNCFLFHIVYWIAKFNVESSCFFSVFFTVFVKYSTGYKYFIITINFCLLTRQHKYQVRTFRHLNEGHRRYHRKVTIERNGLWIKVEMQKYNKGDKEKTYPWQYRILLTNCIECNSCRFDYSVYVAQHVYGIKRQPIVIEIIAKKVSVTCPLL